jgi:hypothetical protein
MGLLACLNASPRRGTTTLPEVESSTLQMERVYLPETLVHTSESTWRHSPEDRVKHTVLYDTFQPTLMMMMMIKHVFRF